ncbi:MAG: flavin-containing monooxygenase [Sphingobium sp.]
MNKPSEPVDGIFDVIILGAGLSGIGSAYHLQTQCPDKSYVVLEGLESYGGTWLVHRYPGVRSDSDLYTFGYRFKPWLKSPIAPASEILDYIGEVIEENDIGRHIRYRHRVGQASWSSEEACWTMTGTRQDTGEAFTVKGRFLWMCQGYYRMDQGYTPQWPGMDDYRGQIIHPQTWPEGLDYQDKKILIIGSGATAATLGPALAPDAAHVTMLQRSPTYFMPGRNAVPTADKLRELRIPEEWIHEIVRREILVDKEKFLQRSLEEPEQVKEELLAGVRAFLPEEEVERNFTPTYRPWSQRMAFVPEGDLFQGIKSGKVDVVTSEIDHFTPTGVVLKSGQAIDVDIVITATGFDLNALGDIPFVVDGKAVDFAQTVGYRGMMFTGIPNMAWVMGYFRVSWTMRVDLLGDFVCRLLKHMDDKGATTVEVALRPEDADMELLCWMDPEDWNPGYLMRNMHLLPKRGTKREWAHSQDYKWEMHELPKVDLDDAVFVYGQPQAGEETAAPRDAALGAG